MSKKYQGAPLKVPSKEKSKTLHEILPSAAPVIWKEKAEKNWRKYPILNQHDTNQCTWFTLVKLHGINYFLDEGEFLFFSPSFGYEQRLNFPTPGDSVDSMRVNGKKGITLESLYPSKTKNNDKVKLTAKNYAVKVGEVFKIGELLDLPVRDIDSVASTIQVTGKGVKVWFWATFDEWQQKEPKVTNTKITLATAPVRHSVTAVDFFLIKGKKYLLIEDSWGVNTGIDGRRLISEDFFSKRNYYAGYLTRFEYSTNPVSSKPTVTSIFGEESDHVQILQKYLQSKGFFPSNHKTTKYYGNITADAVLRWQIANNVDDIKTLTSLKGHVFGPKSLAKV